MNFHVHYFLIPVEKLIYKFVKLKYLKCFCILGKIVTGGKVSSTEGYNGCLRDMDEDFKYELLRIIPHLLMPERLVVKKVNGMQLNGVEFLEYIEKYFKIFQSDRLPQARAVFELTVDTHLTTIVSSCLEKYKFLIYEKPSIIEKIEELPIIHEASKNDVLLMYKDSKKMGNADHEVKFRKILENQIDKIYKEWKEQNETNIRKVEDEKNKTRMAEEEKQKLALDKLKLEQDAAKHKFELEKVKQDFEMQKLVFTKDKEIEQIKFKAENERQADERRHDIEKFKLEQERDREEASKNHEILILKQEGMQNEIIAKSNMEMEKIKGEADIKAAKMQQQFQIAERERSMKEEQLRHAQAMEQQRAKGEAEAKQQLHEAEMSTMNEQIRMQREAAIQNHLHQQELAKAQQKTEEENLKQIILQQKLESEERRHRETLRERERLEEMNNKGLLRKIGGWIW